MNGAAENANNIPKPFRDAGKAIGTMTRTSIVARLARMIRVELSRARAQAKPIGSTMRTAAMDAYMLVQMALVNMLFSKMTDQCCSVRLSNDIRDDQNGEKDT